MGRGSTFTAPPAAAPLTQPAPNAPNARHAGRRHGRAGCAWRGGRRTLALLALLAAAAGPLWAQAAGGDGGEGGSAAGDGLSLAWSAFGTAGYAVSDRAWRYQRFVDDGGTFKRDSVLGAQLDLQLTPQWSATLQPRLAPATRNDRRWDLTAAWAFAAWRPGNDWLLRVGKLRVPFMLRSAQLDVGQTYDEAHLPTEVYGQLPASDFTGAHLTRGWSREGGDLVLDLYHGDSPLVNRNRIALREPAPGAAPAVMFSDLEITVTGAVLSWNTPELSARAGVHHTRVRTADGSGLLVRPRWVELGGGAGYWQTRGPGLERVDSSNNLALTLGAEARLGGGWRVAGEWLRIIPRELEMGMSSTSAYVTAYRSWSALTAYASVAAVHPGRGPLQWVRQLETTTVPGSVPNAAALNASMRSRADTIPLFRQRSLALGAAYALSPTSKLKAEWLHTRAQGSQFMDVPAGQGLLQPRRVNVLSVSYSFAF